MRIEVNTLSTYWGSKNRRNFSVEVADLNEDTLRKAIFEKVRIDERTKVENETFKLVNDNRLLLHTYDIVDIEKEKKED